jgi:hypothetical protein
MNAAPVLASEGLYPQSKRPDPAVRKLALGILLQAFRDVVAPKSTSNREAEIWREDALEWFASDETHPGSLTWVCQVLQVNPVKLHRWLDAYRNGDREHKKEMARKLIRFQIPH